MSTPLSPPRVLCLDLGDVVVRICHGWSEAAARAGLPDRFASGDDVSRWLPLMREHDHGRIDNTDYFDQLASLFGYRYSPEEVSRIHAAFLIDEHPRVDEVILAAKSRGLLTSCLSNTNAQHWEMMSDPRRTDIWRAFRALDRRLASHLLGMSKPDRAIYDAATRALEATPSEILFFDDRAENVAAAREAGWRAEVIRADAPTAEQIAHGLSRHGVDLSW